LRAWGPVLGFRNRNPTAATSRRNRSLWPLPPRVRTFSPLTRLLPWLAASEIREYAQEHAALFERAERLRAKAERLQGEGTPSESANNRAERARAEVEAGLLALRERFAPSAGERKRAFDHEAGRLYPGLAAGA